MDRVKLAIESLQTHIDYDKRAYGMQTGAIIIGIAEAEAILDLLKEKEAVEPEKEHSGSGITWWNVCGNCKTAINPNDKYCHECGRPVLWEGR